MAVSSVQNANVAAWSQLQQVQAERAAEQAVATARGLQAQARKAEEVADRAQENARVVRTQADRADVDANRAQRSVSAMNSLSGVREQFADLQTQIREVLASDPVISPTPVVNAYGETTGSVVNVTA